MTKESLNAELVKRAQLLSPDQKSFITNRAEYIRATIAEYETMKLSGLQPPPNMSHAESFSMALLSMIQEYDDLQKTNDDMERNCFICVEKIRRQLIFGMTDHHFKPETTPSLEIARAEPIEVQKPAELPVAKTEGEFNGETEH